MLFLGQNDEEKIFSDLREIIEEKLLSEIKDKRQRPVIKVDSINIFEYNIDEDQSDRNTIVFSTILVATRVWVKNNESGGSSNDNFQLRNIKPIKFLYDEDLKVFKIENKEHLQFFNTLPY